MTTSGWKAPLVAALAALPLLAQAAPVQVRVNASLNLNPMATVCTDLAQTATASVSCSTDGTNTTGSPYSLGGTVGADATNLGHLRVSGSAHALGRTPLPAQTEATGASWIDIQDLHHFSAPGLAGQAGTVTASFLVTGELVAVAPNGGPAVRSNGRARMNLTYAVYPTGTAGGGDTLVDIYHDHTQLRSDWTIDLCSLNFVNAPCADTLGLFTIEIPFVWGEDLPFFFRVMGAASAVTLDDGLEASASYDFGQSIVWGGFSNVRAGSTPVTDYDYRSGTGHDWRVSSIDAPSGVPEPGTAALVALAMLGFAVAAARGGAGSARRPRSS